MSATAPSTLVCPNCGAAAVAGDRFCEACGHDLPVTEPVAAIPADTEPGGPLPARPTCPSCGADAGEILDGYCGVCGLKQPALRDHTEAVHDRVAAVSDRGVKHHRNEDAYALRVEEGQPIVAVVCDGVSTTVNPDQASQAAADAAVAALVANPADLVAAHAAAQAAVAAVEGQPQPPDLGWPSCTFLAGVVDAAGVTLATLGDCRAFWLPVEGPAQTVTEDDSWAAEMIAAGALTPEEAYAHPLSHSITRWLGRDAEPEWEPRVVRFDFPGAGRLLLTSDGLWNYAPTGDEVAAAAGGGPGIEVARRLVDFANGRGGHDNITVVVIDVDQVDGNHTAVDQVDGTHTPVDQIGAPADPTTDPPKDDHTKDDHTKGCP